MFANLGLKTLIFNDICKNKSVAFIVCKINKAGLSTFSNKFNDRINRQYHRKVSMIYRKKYQIVALNIFCYIMYLINFLSHIFGGTNTSVKFTRVLMKYVLEIRILQL
jgi:hypothetical protein